MRLWVHLIWRETNPGVMLQSGGPREDRKLEEFIRSVPDGEESTAALAWHLYVNQDPRPYNLAPVEIAIKQTGVTKSGNAWSSINTAEDHSSITRFPLSAFLAVKDGYVVEAMCLLDEFMKLRKQYKEQGKPFKEFVAACRSHRSGLLRVFEVHDLMQKQISNMGRKWGAALEFDEENVSSE